MSELFVNNTSFNPNTGFKDHPYNLQRAIERFERGYLQNVLVIAEWDNVKAAEMLGIRLDVLESKLEKYELQDYKA